MSDIKVSSGPAIGFIGILTIVLVVLKALGYITWSWWLVFSPIIFSAFVWFLVLALLFTIGFFIVKEENKQFKKNMDKYFTSTPDKRFK